MIAAVVDAPETTRRRSRALVRRRGQRRKASWDLAIGIAGFATLAFLIPAYAVPSLNFGKSGVGVALLLVAYSALRLAILLAHGRPYLMECAFWTFSYSFLALPLLAQISAGQYPLATAYTYDASSIAETETLTIIGFVGYEVGRHFVVKRRRRNTAATNDIVENVSVLRAWILGYAGLGFVLLAVLQHGLASFFESRDALTQNFLGTAAEGVKFYLNEGKASGVSLQALSQVPIFVGTYLLLYVRHARRHNPAASRPSPVLLIPLIVGNVIINNPIANARFWYGTVLIAFATIYLPLRTKKSAMRVFVVIFVAISIFSFTQLSAFRHSGGSSVSSQPIAQTLLTDPDYASPQQMMNGIEYVAGNGFSAGKQLAGTAFIWVPRTLWPGKPGDTGQLVGGAAGFKVSAPLWTEGYVDFGVLGCLAYLVIAGWAAQRLDLRFAASAGANLRAAFAPIMASLLVFLLRGSLQPAFGSLLPVIACVLFCLSTARLRAGIHRIRVGATGSRQRSTFRRKMKSLG